MNTRSKRSCCTRFHRGIAAFHRRDLGAQVGQQGSTSSSWPIVVHAEQSRRDVGDAQATAFVALRPLVEQFGHRLLQLATAGRLECSWQWTSGSEAWKTAWSVVGNRPGCCSPGAQFPDALGEQIRRNAAALTPIPPG